MTWWRRRVRLTGGRGVDLVVDSVGTTLEGSIAATAYRGRIVSRRQRRAVPRSRSLDVGKLSEMNRSLTGVFFGGSSRCCEPQRGAATGRAADRRRGDRGLRVVIDRTYPLSEAAAAHAYMESRQAFGRVVLIP